MAAVFAEDLHGPRGALALAAGVRRDCTSLQANMVCALVTCRALFCLTTAVPTICPVGRCIASAEPRYITAAAGLPNVAWHDGWHLMQHVEQAFLAHRRQVHNSLRKQRRLLEKEAVSFARQADRLDGEAGFMKLRRHGAICLVAQAAVGTCAGGHVFLHDETEKCHAGRLPRAALAAAAETVAARLALLPALRELHVERLKLEIAQNEQA